MKVKSSLIVPILEASILIQTVGNAMAGLCRQSEEKPPYLCRNWGLREFEVT